YPFMFSDKLVFAGAMISGAISGAFVGFLGVRGTAYVPSFSAPFLSNNGIGFAISMAVALVSSFTFTFIANKVKMKKR
ncbi:MAG: PTS sugar transporter, partial [Halanaerobium sp. MSAO_Bac5]